jgi:uncharacterized protein (TIGR00730 family)
MQRICAFAGSNPGNHPAYVEAALQLGRVLAAERLELVYGGSCIGLMGKLADTVLELGGTVTGVIPTGLFCKEMVHRRLTKLIEVKNMHERKAKMHELADAYIALPGGLGTFEEIFETVCWGQLGIHSKPVGLLNVEGYYLPLLDLVEKGVEAEFISQVHRELIIVDENPATLLQKLRIYRPPARTNKWQEPKK